MKKNIVFNLIVIFLISIVNSYSQNETKAFSGVIKYDLNYRGDIDQKILAKQPLEYNIKINGNESRTDFEEGGAEIRIIKNGNTKTIITLMYIPLLNKKVMIRTSFKFQVPSFKLKLVDGIKEIAGYKCKKGELITKDKEGKEVSDEFYYTEALGNNDYNFDTPYRDVKGILLEYVKRNGNIKIIFTATQVNRQPISELEFIVPTGYEEMTIEQLGKLYEKK